MRCPPSSGQQGTVPLSEKLRLEDLGRLFEDMKRTPAGDVPGETFKEALQRSIRDVAETAAPFAPRVGRPDRPPTRASADGSFVKH